jgi:hypothetical protein
MISLVLPLCLGKDIINHNTFISLSTIFLFNNGQEVIIWIKDISC